MTPTFGQGERAENLEMVDRLQQGREINKGSQFSDYIVGINLFFAFRLF